MDSHLERQLHFVTCPSAGDCRRGVGAELSRSTRYDSVVNRRRFRNYPTPSAILRNRFSHSGPDHQADQVPTYPAADSSAQAVWPCPPMTHWRKRHARFSDAQRYASAFPWVSIPAGSECPAPIQAGAEWYWPALLPGHDQLPAGTHRPAYGNDGRQRLNRQIESPRAARILAPDKGTTPAARQGDRASIPDRRGIPSVATRRHCFGFGS